MEAWGVYGRVVRLLALLFLCFSTCLARPAYDLEPGTREMHGHIIYNVVSYLALLFIAVMFGSRVRHFNKASVRNLSFMRAVVTVMYVFATCFIFAAATLELGVTTTKYVSCRAGVYVCLIFYFGTKILIYMFLVERAHALRAFYCRRYQDWVWVTGTATLAVGWGAIAIIAFLWPSVDLNGSSGECRFGWPLKVTIPVITYDVFINVALTGLFTYMLQSGFKLSLRLPSTAASRLQVSGRRASILIKLKPQFEGGEYEDGVNQANLKAIRTLLHKTIIGCAIVMMPTIINIALLTQGVEQSWLCFTICTIDVTLQVVVVHWLTNDPSDPPQVENNQLSG